MSFRMDNAAAIPSRSERASRGRLLASLGSGQVGAMGWRPGARGGLSGQTLVKVKNAGSNAIKRWEAGSVLTFSTAVGGYSVAPTEFFEAVFDCGDAIDNGCHHDFHCDLGTCGQWPVTYSDVYDKAYALEPVVFQVTTSAPTIPTPADLGAWLVAAEDIAVGEYGMAYAAGIHYAMVWDPDDLLENGGECRYVDLPMYGAAYDPDDSSPTINLPLQVRPNGRARVLAYDHTEHVYHGDPSSTWPMEKVRLALIQRCDQFVYPTIVATITDANLSSANLWTYEWQATHNTSCTHELVAEALNLCESANTAENVNGIPSTQLDDCFGEGCWELQDLDAHAGQVLLTIGMTADGAMQPMCQVMNQIIEKSC